MITNIFIQARMSSSRFPGKVLAPLYGKPLIKHIIEKAKYVNNIEKVVVLTSSLESDDPLASYLDRIKCDYFRGNLDNVFKRFRSALEPFPCEYFVRICGDSPFINSQLIKDMMTKLYNKDHDIITNVMRRTFPKGHSVEIIKTKLFLEADETSLTNEDKEHVFPYFYRNAAQFKICSVDNVTDQSHINYCVDTLQDLERLTSN